MAVIEVLSLVWSLQSVASGLSQACVTPSSPLVLDSKQSVASVFVTSIQMEQFSSAEKCLDESTNQVVATGFQWPASDQVPKFFCPEFRKVEGQWIWQSFIACPPSLPDPSAASFGN